MSPNNNFLEKIQKNSFYKKYHGFTLVELIVVVTIVAILTTIAFIYIGSWYGQARNSTRLTNIDSIAKGFEIFAIESGNYPIPDNAKSVTFLGGDLWLQGIIGETVSRSIRSMDKNITDPKFGNNYTYSLLASTPGTNAKRAFEIGAVIEGDAVYGYFPHSTYASSILDPLPTAFAANDLEHPYSAYLKGTFNNLVAKTKTGSTCYTVALPSIVLTEIPTSGKIEDAGSGSLVFSGKKNIPESYVNQLPGSKVSGNSTFRDYATDSNNLILSTDCTTPTSALEVATFSENIKQAYVGTDISNKETYTILTQTADAPSQIKVGADIINSYLGGSVSIPTNEVLPDFYCITNSPTVSSTISSIGNITNITLGSPNHFGQSWIYSNIPGNCTFSCEAGYAWDASSKSCVLDSCTGVDLALLNGTQIAGATQSYLQSWKHDSVDTDSVCRYQCNVGFTYDSGSMKCEPNNCTAQTQIVGANPNDHTYLVPFLNHGTTQLVISNVKPISNGTTTYNQNFSCTNGNISLSGSEVLSAQNCSLGFHSEGLSCVANTTTCTYTNPPYASNIQPANSTGGNKSWSTSSYGTCTGFGCTAGYGSNGTSCIALPGNIVAGTHVSNSTSITFNWSSLAGATGYKWSATNNIATATDIGNTLTQTYGSVCGTSYSIYVWPYNAGGNAINPTIFTQTSIMCPPATPTGLAASSIVSTSFTLSWSAVGGASSYDVYRNGVLYVNTASTSYSITSLAGGTSYSMTVVAKNIGGSSAASSALSVTTLQSCPAGYTNISGTCYSPLRGPVGYRAAWDNCASEGAAIISNTGVSPIICGITGNCAAITGTNKIAWWYGNSRDSYGVAVVSNLNRSQGAGGGLSVDTYASNSFPAFFGVSTDTLDATHYYWCQK